MTMTRTSSSPSRSSSAAVSPSTRSPAIELLPFRASVMVPIRPSLDALTIGASVVDSLMLCLRKTALERKQVNSAGHVHDLTGDVARFLGAEERDGIGDILRLPRFAENGALDDALVHLGVAHLVGLGSDHPGRD